MKYFCQSILLSVLPALIACEPSIEETQRLTSPDGKVDAVVTVTNVHATTPFVHRVYVTPHGGEAEESFEKFRASHVHALKVYWAANQDLVISCGDARIYHFSNFWMSKSVDNFNYVVRIRLK